MFIDWKAVKIFVCSGVVDLRKQINGLALRISYTMKIDSEPLPNNVEELQQVIVRMGSESDEKIERTLREENLEPEQFLEQRRGEVEPILRKLRSRLESRHPQVPPSTLLGKAIGYALGQWPELLPYLGGPHLHPDNNACERAIRHFVVGRNYAELSITILFSVDKYPEKRLGTL